MAERTCCVDGCERVHYGKGFCKLHYDRQRTRGTTEGVAEILKTKPPRADMAWSRNRFWRGDEAGIDGAHKRVRKLKGLARSHLCVECGSRAAHWAYDHKDPNERVSPEGSPYSLKVEYYQPMCVPCHRRFDFAHARGKEGLGDGLSAVG